MVYKDRIYCPKQESLESKEGASNYASTIGINKPGLLQAKGVVWSSLGWEKSVRSPAYKPNLSVWP